MQKKNRKSNAFGFTPVVTLPAQAVHFEEQKSNASLL
jgi:hypothetical protein